MAATERPYHQQKRDVNLRSGKSRWVDLHSSGCPTKQITEYQRYRKTRLVRWNRHHNRRYNLSNTIGIHIATHAQLRVLRAIPGMPKNQWTHADIDAISHERPVHVVEYLRYRANGIGHVVSSKICGVVRFSNKAPPHRYFGGETLPTPSVIESLLLQSPSYHDDSQTTVPVVQIPKATLEPEKGVVYLVQMVQSLRYYMSAMLTRKALSPGQLWLDTGCACGLGGARQHKVLGQVYGQFNICLVAERHNDTLQFGNGNTEQATLLNNDLVFSKGITEVR